ncbi:MAG: hypothetical protein AB7O37_22850 [Vicinamibacteria bacterium]
MTIDWAILSLGLFGGLVPDMIRLARELRDKSAPSPLHAGLVASMAILGLLGATCALVLDAKNAKEAIAFGFSAPELLSRLASQPPPPGGNPGPKPGGGGFSLRAWWVN